MGRDMAKLTLYEHPLSPYAQKNKMALREKEIDFACVTPDAIGTGGANNSPEYRPQMVRESADKPRDRLRWEIIGIIHKSGHIWVSCHHRRWCFPHVTW